MENPRPTKRVRFLEDNSTPRPTRSPSAQDIYKWTGTVNATAPCFVRDVHSMRENVTENGSFYWLGHIPCRTVLVIGVVVGIDVFEKWTTYTIDDSTAVIECSLYHPLPFAHLNLRSMSAEELRALRSRPLPPPPLPVTAIGYPVEVIGKVAQFHGSRHIKATMMKGCESTNDQFKHMVTVVGLHKSKYAVPKPFEIPVETRSVKPPPSEPSSPLTHSATSVASSFIVHSTDQPQFLHPSRLHTADLTDDTFEAYLEHYLHHAPGNVPEWSEGLQSQDSTSGGSTSPAFTLSHLRRVPELALLANRVVYAETRRRAGPGVGEEKANHTRKPFVSRFSFKHPRLKMKNLFMWAILQLYQEGSIVLYDGPLAPSTAALPTPPSDTARTSSSSAIFSCPGAASSKSVISDDDAYLSDPPPYEEDEAYVPVTAALLVQPVREIMIARGIKGKSTEVRVDDIARDLKRSDPRWVCIDLEDVEDAIQLVEID